MSEQEKLTVKKLEGSFDGIPVKCTPAGEFIKDNKTITYPHSVKVGNGFKTIADFRSQKQINGFCAALQAPRFRKWISENLPETTDDNDSEVDETT